MKKVLLFLFFTMLLGSCKMFTTSFGKAAVRDQSKVFSKATTEDLAKMAGSIQGNNKKTARELLVALGTKSGELQKLDRASKENILNLGTGAGVSINNIKDALFGGTEFNEKNLVDTLFNKSEAYDTRAIVTLLAENNITDQVSADVVADAAVTVMANVVREIGYENIKTKIKDKSIELKSVTASDLLPASATPAQKEQVDIAIAAAKKAGEKNAKLFGMASLSEVFSKIGK